MVKVGDYVQHKVTKYYYRVNGICNHDIRTGLQKALLLPINQTTEIEVEALGPNLDPLGLGMYLALNSVDVLPNQEVLKILYG